MVVDDGVGRRRLRSVLGRGETDGAHAHSLRSGDVGAGRVAHMGGLPGGDSQGREGAVKHPRIRLGKSGLVGERERREVGQQAVPLQEPQQDSPRGQTRVGDETQLDARTRQGRNDLGRPRLELQVRVGAGLLDAPRGPLDDAINRGGAEASEHVDHLFEGPEVPALLPGLEVGGEAGVPRREQLLIGGRHTADGERVADGRHAVRARGLGRSVERLGVEGVPKVERDSSDVSRGLDRCLPCQSRVRFGVYAPQWTSLTGTGILPGMFLLATLKMPGYGPRGLRRAVVAIALLGLALLGHPTAAAAAVGFPDVSATHPYHLQIEVLAQLGVVAGFSDGRFRPEAPVTRQQFAKMVVLAMRIPVSEADVSAFSDVMRTGPETLFPDNYVAAVAREGITTGTKKPTPTAPGLFSPGVEVSLAQVVTMMTRASGKALTPPSEGYRSTWGDFNIAHGPTARLAQYNGLLRYFPTQAVSPWKSATRGEVSALLYNLMGTDLQGLNGLFLGQSSDLVGYFRAQNRTSERFTVPLGELARLYVVYGHRFGIRADMAWAQMVHETGFGEYGGDVKPGQNNMAGIGATGGVPGNSFSTAELGVIAHYIHLAWYIYPDHLDDPYCVRSVDPAVPGDPRHFVIDGKPHKGNVRTVLDLSGKWAVPGIGYGAALQRIANGIEVTVGY